MKSTSSYTHVYLKDEVIFEQGDLGTSACIIEKGRVEISVLKDGQKLVLAEYGEGDLFGEMALIDETTRSATATALETTEVVTIYRSIFDTALQHVNPVIRLMMHTMMYQRRQTNPSLLSKAESDKYYSLQKKNDPKYSHAHAETINLVMAENELSDAIDNAQFELYYQPIFALKNNQITGVEALIRWNHPEGDLITPDEFMPIAESTSLINKLGKFIIDSVCLQVNKLTEELPGFFDKKPGFFIGLNLSAEQFIYSDLLNQIKTSVKAYNVPSNHIMLEITEGILMFEPETAKTVLNDFKQQGFRIAVDDFGKGYSCMSHLHSFPIDTIKIDRTFIDSMHTNKASRNIIHAITAFAKTIGLEVIAEGVETEEQFNNAKLSGCEQAQGYYFNKPMPFTDMISLLKNQS